MPTVERSGVGIHYEVVEGSGPPLVLLHGMMGTSETWRIEGYLDALAGDFRLITIDLRGHGRSSAPHDPAAYSLAEFVADVVGVLDDAGADSAYVCGFSQGADISLALAGRHPDRIAGVLTLGLSSCNQGFDDVPWNAPAEDDMPPFESLGMTWITKMLEEDGRPAWARMLGQADPEAQIAILRADAIDGRISGLRLRDLAVPLICVWGEKEPPRQLPLPAHARVEIIPGADHVGTVEHREIVVPLLRSLALPVAAATSRD
jgi:pimeloyl-ACP methyl ester carboxylesterase